MKNQISSSIQDKINSVSEPAKASIAFILCSIFQKGLSTLTLPLFTRLLSTEQYGVYSVYMSWYSIIQIFGTLNLFLGVFNNGMIKFEDDRDRFQSSMLGLSTTISILFVLLYVLFKDIWITIMGLSSFFIVIMFIQLIFTSAYEFWAARQRFEYKYKLLVLITVISSVISPIIGVVLVKSTSYKAEARVFAYVLVQIIVGIYIFYKTFEKNTTFFCKKYWKYGLCFNLPLVPHYLSGVILNQADRIMIKNMESASAAAIYSVAYNLAFMVSIMTTAINNSYIPFTYKKIRNGEFKDLRKISKIISIIVLIPILCIVLFGPELIKIFATREYYDAIWIIPPVAVSVYVIFIYGLFINVEFYFERNKFIMIASITGAILNLLLNSIFIKQFGYLAAGYTTLVCYLLFMLGHFIFYKIILRQEKIDSIYDISYLFVLVFISIIVMFLMFILYKMVILRYFIIGLVVGCIIINRKKIIDIVLQIKNC